VPHTIPNLDCVGLLIFPERIRVPCAPSSRPTLPLPWDPGIGTQLIPSGDNYLTINLHVSQMWSPIAESDHIWASTDAPKSFRS